MAFQSISPFDGSINGEFPDMDDAQLEAALARAAAARQTWAATPLETRSQALVAVALTLREQRDALAQIITQEMGKLITEARAEVEKCAMVCEYYAEQAHAFLADEVIHTDAGKSYVAYQPLGVVLAVMPWNFPFWQVFRFAAPALAAGNVGLLKHASNVPRCALMIEQVFKQAGLPHGVFQSLMIGSGRVAQVIEDERIAAVTLTGSEPAGRSVARTAGGVLKKTVLELGGSDPFIVLDDADLESTVPVAVTSRFLNSGQSCIAAKRFLVTRDIYDGFLAAFKSAVQALVPGDPLDESTTLAPMAREDLLTELHTQVRDALDKGAQAVTGCERLDRTGVFYAPSILAGITPDMRAWSEELFGPVALVIKVKDADEALKIANSSRFGLGASVWTQDRLKGERIALQLQCGAAFVNGLVKSDPRLPFGGIKASGYGRELCHHGIREFVNAKTMWLGRA